MQMLRSFFKVCFQDMLNGAIVIKNYGGIFLLETSCSIAILPVIVKHLMHLLLDFFFTSALF